MPLLASTGSKDLDENADRHVVIVEGYDDEIEVPGLRPQAIIVFNKISYVHVGEDAEGRWTYRPL